MAINQLTHENFQAYDYQTSNTILKENFITNREFLEKTDSKTLFLCIGVNGSGKSTYLANLYSKTSFNLPYFNADLLAQVLPRDIKLQASVKATHIADHLVDKGISFCFESVFTHPSKLELVKKAKENGYKVVGTYVYVKSCEMNKQRVQNRVKQGGHYIPPAKIEERYKKMKRAVCGLIEYCDELYFFDNTKCLPLIKKESERVVEELCQN